MDFREFIIKFFPSFQIDEKNEKTIFHLGLWADRNEEFNSLEPGWHIDRGILLSGPVGVGKDETFRMLRQYLEFLKSPYRFKFRIVWEFARPYMKDGYECFSEEMVGNLYYEELALTDEITGQPTREIVNHFGTKILIGSEIINFRYNIFKNTGYQTHFSTNLNEDQLEKVYGARCFSRINEMCNIVFLQGKDKRGLIEPKFKKNLNQPPPPVSQIDLAPQVISENKRILDCGYTHYIKTGNFPNDIHFYYDALVGFGVQVCTQQELQSYMDDSEAHYFGHMMMSRQTPEEKEQDKRNFKWKEARDIAVKTYFNLLKSQDAKSIFGIVSVNIDAIIKPVVADKKDDSSDNPQTERRNEAK